MMIQGSPPIKLPAPHLANPVCEILNTIYIRPFFSMAFSFFNSIKCYIQQHFIFKRNTNKIFLKPFFKIALVFQESVIRNSENLSKMSKYVLISFWFRINTFF